MENSHLKRAYALAKKAVGLTSPNPAVGAVIIRGGEVIGFGFTEPAGGDHAEIQAIKSAKKSLVGATLFVTLEPCSHYGKTPPCVDAIIAAGIKKVVIGMPDPFPKVNGQGIAILQKNKIEVELLPPESELRARISNLNQPFLKAVATGLPYVVLKAAMTLDGKIATKNGESKWITGDPARADARRLRSVCDAVLVGGGTVAADNPELAPSVQFKNKKLLRIIIDGKLATSPDSLVYRDSCVLVATTERAPRKRIDLFKKKGIKTEAFGETEVSIPKLLRYLYKSGIQKVFVEGGAGVHGAFVDAALKNKRMVDEVVFYIAPKIIGGAESLAAVGGTGVEKMAKALPILDWTVAKIGEDFKITGLMNRY